MKANQNPKSRTPTFLVITLFSVLFSLLITSCDLFSGPQVDLMQKIEDEVAWANADKLTVRIAYPGDWGTSSPGAGPVSMDIRKSYAFDLEFTPDIAYSFQGWRVYATSVLNEAGDWIIDPSLLDDEDAPVPQLSGVVIPTLPARGGKGSFTINTATPVTLVPWCKTEPYVIRTDPRGESRGSTTMRTYLPTTAVTVYFNTVLENGNWEFWDGAAAPENIMVGIRARPTNTIAANGAFSVVDWFETPVYESRAGQHTVTITPKSGSAGPQNDHQIEVTIGPNIRDAAGEPMTAPEVLYYKVAASASADVSINTWSAVYNESSAGITVTCTIAGTDAGNADTTMTAWYQVDKGANQPFTLSKSGTTFTGTISGTGRIDDSGVREGRSVSGGREYHIFVQLNAGGENNIENDSFKIWNFPLMSVSKTNPAIELTNGNFNSTFQAGANAASATYVLTENVSLTSWTPRSGAFTGKFYGNGHTVTINTMNTAAGMGLFGVVDGGTVRDLTVMYGAGASVNPTDTALFGGIAGTAKGAALLENVAVKGTFSYSMGGTTGDRNIYVGGIVGLMSGSTKAINVHSSIKLTVDRTTGSTSGYTGSGAISGGTAPTLNTSIYVGGVVGSMGTPGTDGSSGQSSNDNGGDPVRLENATVTGSITVGSNANRVNSCEPTVDLGVYKSNVVRGLHVGGLAGLIRGAGTSDAQKATIKNAHYRGGTIQVYSASGRLHTGGAVGIAYRYADILDCSSTETQVNCYKNAAGIFFMGGFIGNTGPDTLIQNCHGDSNIVCDTTTSGIYIGGFGGRLGGTTKYCYAKGVVEGTNNSAIYAGGFAGHVNTVTNCFTGSNVKITNTTSSGNAQCYTGGFAGQSTGSISDCYALGNVYMEKTNAGISVTTYTGGLIGQSSSVINCFAAGSVTVHRNNGASYSSTSYGDIRIGGLIGNLSSGSITNSAALGASVTATGYTYAPADNSFNRLYIGRIYGTASTTTSTNNRVYADMKLYKHNTWKYAMPDVSPLPAGTDVHTGSNGADAGDSEFRRSNIWQNAAPTTSDPPHATHGLNFSPAVWDFSTVNYYGHPVLRGEYGMRMGGQ